MKTRLLLFMVPIFFVACTSESYILVSKDPNNMVTNWLLREDASLKIKDCYSLTADSLQYYIKHSKGIVICGGEDVNPVHYLKPEYDSLCEGYDNYRDSLEFMLIEFAMLKKIPLLGICRGQQILNIANGGTLIPDIPTFKPNDTVSHRDKKMYSHSVTVTHNSWLNDLAHTNFNVNSRHHQSVGIVAPGFRIAALAPDSIIESIEWIDVLTHPFAKGVQWHPEGLTDSVSIKIALTFINQTNEFEKH